MKMITLNRITFCNHTPTFGVLFADGFPFVLTLENRWEQNIINVSCIPPGHYTCKRINSPHFGDTFEVCDVTGRTHILFHKGNWEKDTSGCILVGSGFMNYNCEPGISGSKNGFAKLMNKLKGIDEFSLMVILNDR